MDRHSGKRRLRIPLRLNIIILFLFLFGVLGLVLGTVASRTSQRLVDETVSTSFLKSADLALLELDQLEQTARSAAEALAANPIIQAETQEERGQHFHQLATVLRSVPGVSAAYVGWTDGDFLLLRPVGRHEEQLGAPPDAAWLVQWAHTQGARFEFLDEDLDVLETRTDVAYDFDPRERPWYEKARRVDETIVTAPYVFFTTREPGITAARRAPSGAVAGVDVSLWELSQSLQAGRLVPATEAAILDSDGSVLAHTDLQRLKEAVQSGVGGDSHELEALPSAESVGPPVLSALSARSREIEESSTEALSIDGQDWLSTLVPLDGRGTTFVMAAPMEEIAAGPRLVRARMLQTFGLVMLVAAPMVWLSGRALARPVERLAENVGRIAHLDFTASAQGRSRIRELAELEDALEDMRLALRKRMSELRCLYDVLELTSDRSRPVGDICRDIVPLLEKSLIQLPSPVVRLELEGKTFLSGNREVLAGHYRAFIQGVYKQVGFIEVGSADPGESDAGQDILLPAEERQLVDGVATHIGRMLHSRQMAEELTQSERLRALGQLTGGVAHDFNNLLTVILGNTEILGTRVSDPELRELAETAANAAERGSDLTRRLLAFAGQQTLEPRLVNPNDLVSGLETLFQRTLRENIEIAIRCDEGTWTIHVDPVLLEVALLNLVINARDAIRAKGRIRIETGNVTFSGQAAEALQLAAGDYVEISVTDNGSGMTPDVEAKAFEPFFTTKEVGKGSGLGLSMVYGFVRQSRGHVGIESTPGAGTVIRVYLPRSEALAEAAVETAGRQEVSSDRKRRPEGAGKLLVVEDDDLVRSYVATQLESLGYEVVAVRDAEQARARLNETRDFDLLFTDLIMPGDTNGRQLAREALKLQPSLKVLYTSGYAETERPDETELPEDAEVLHKPYRRSDLVDKIGTMLLS
ncbi:ATP-binding protein [Fodinicurvata halophila]|uniref:histidine kinase n=1 Tax=Fodinicurvata halophila TaxID=1419723 RepID=A0ABV8UN85_9PROT